jgi:hypothetical protein
MHHAGKGDRKVTIQNPQSKEGDQKGRGDQNTVLSDSFHLDDNETSCPELLDILAPSRFLPF